jgi:hypothetical protein
LFQKNSLIKQSDMKTKLLSLSLLITMLGYSQTAIEQFQSATGSQYAEVTGTIDQSASGNVSWDFTGLTTTSTILTDTYTGTPPTSTIQTSNGATVISTIGLNTSGGVLSFTSFLSSGIQLNYSNFAVIGTFPLSFGYSNTDGVEGTFTGPVSGDVLNTSTINAAVDAWGTLKVGTFDGAVTRFKIVQNLDLSAVVPPFPFAVTSTGTQTSFFYYDANSNDLVFRTSRLQVGSPVNIDETIMETLLTYALNNNKYEMAESDIKLVNNPVQDVLRFSVSDFIEIKGITISDISGRIVLKTDTNESSINVNQLKSGLFLVSIRTNKGVLTKKFLKQ